MKLLNVDHAQITVPPGAENDAREFYCRVLGLEEIAKPEALQGRGGFWMRLDGFPIHVGMEDGADRAATKAHIGYLVDDIDAWRNTLENKGIEILEGVQIPHFRRFEFRDPFGNRVEFLQRV
jgi:catechol 2,3-dioxygenase-like lactoylglutathione lyase family enzyme